MNYVRYINASKPAVHAHISTLHLFFLLAGFYGQFQSDAAFSVLHSESLENSSNAYAFPQLCVFMCKLVYGSDYSWSDFCQEPGLARVSCFVNRCVTLSVNLAPINLINF